MASKKELIEEFSSKFRMMRKYLTEFKELANYYGYLEISKRSNELHAYISDFQIETESHLESQVKIMKCCGNCGWNTNAIIHDKCNPSIWVKESSSRGRGLCDNWKDRANDE